MKLAEQYEKPEFITDDPVQFPRRFGYKCSQEIVGFIAAWLAYGNRKAILSTCEKLCKEMERLTPYMYIKNMGWRKYIDSEEPLYRFFKEKDFADLCRALKEIYDNNEDMEEALSKNYTRTMGATDYLDALISLFPGVNTIPRKMCERIRSLAFERGLTLSRNKLSDKIVGGDLVVSDMLNGVVISIEHD